MAVMLYKPMKLTINLYNWIPNDICVMVLIYSWIIIRKEIKGHLSQIYSSCGLRSRRWNVQIKSQKKSSKRKRIKGFSIRYWEKSCLRCLREKTKEAPFFVTTITYWNKAQDIKKEAEEGRGQKYVSWKAEEIALTDGLRYNIYPFFLTLFNYALRVCPLTTSEW